MRRRWLPARTSGEGRGRGPARREEDAAASDEPLRGELEDIVWVASRQWCVAAEPVAGETSTKRGRAAAARATGGAAAAGATGGAAAVVAGAGKGSGGGSRSHGREGRSGDSGRERRDCVWLGTFTGEAEAGHAYDVAAQQFHGRDTVTKLPPLVKSDSKAAVELCFFASRSKAEVIDMLRKHTYLKELVVELATTWRRRQQGELVAGAPVAVATAVRGPRRRRRQSLAGAPRGGAVGGGGCRRRPRYPERPRRLTAGLGVAGCWSASNVYWRQRRRCGRGSWRQRLLAAWWWRATAQRRFAEAVARVGGSGDGGHDCGGGGDVGSGDGDGEVAERSAAAAAVVVTVSAVIRGMAASDGLPRAWETAATGRRGIDIWSSFTDPRTAHQAVRTIGFIEVGNKSLVWDKDIGPGEDLEQFILKFPITKSLVVPNAQLKFVIEKKLNIGCWFNGRIVPELIWGLNYALDEFVPQEKGNLSNECHFPLSKQLHEQLKAYGFSISPQLINREFITSFGYLNYLERTSKNISRDLHQKFDRFFCGLEMSERVFVKVVADRLRSMEEVASTPGRREALSNAEFLLTVPKKYNTLSRLKRMEAEIMEAEVRGSGLGHPWVCVAVFAVALGVMEGLRIAMKRAN
ncbi:hypothetical protein OsI_34248 [Oryza sativa Indica Group]|uniref:AP2/ERF domain-containing protein n=1 Tax=Oryza sativa subsp. indica TaxID=39946 RepID=B8BHS0_ORYSI|nr:hypothetical protein OsI_34248 [Oryza sativa Indica Group]